MWHSHVHELATNRAHYVITSAHSTSIFTWPGVDNIGAEVTFESLEYMKSLQNLPDDLAQRLNEHIPTISA